MNGASNRWLVVVLTIAGSAFVISLILPAFQATDHWTPETLARKRARSETIDMISCLQACMSHYLTAHREAPLSVSGEVLTPLNFGAPLLTERRQCSTRLSVRHT